MLNSRYNENSMDVLVMRVTSKSSEEGWKVEILRDELEEGALDIEPSYVKVDSIFTVEKRIIRKVVDTPSISMVADFVFSLSIFNVSPTIIWIVGIPSI